LNFLPIRNEFVLLIIAPASNLDKLYCVHTSVRANLTNDPESEFFHGYPIVCEYCNVPVSSDTAAVFSMMPDKDVCLFMKQFRLALLATGLSFKSIYILVEMEHKYSIRSRFGLIVALHMKSLRALILDHHGISSGCYSQSLSRHVNFDDYKTLFG